MPGDYIIAGSIDSGDDTDQFGRRVQAFDRELPSVERRSGSGPVCLGEGTANQEGQFRITYTVEQFSPADSAPRVDQLHPTGADLSFRVFDRWDRELAIRRVEALDREHRPDQFIFNAPPELQVRLFVATPAEAGDSEYERLLALLGPVILDVPLAELSEDDMAFVAGELDLEQQPEDWQRVQWLRRSARLAAATSLPVEAFYGWGRMDRPAALVDLAAVDVQKMPEVLHKLENLDAGQLDEALMAAIGENIIPAGFRDRIDDTVLRLKRRRSELRSTVAQLLDEEAGRPLGSYAVTTFHQNNASENRGLDITDDEGRFSFDFYVPAGLPPDAPPQSFTFRVVTPAGEELPQGEPMAIDSNHLAGDPIPVRIQLPGPQTPPIEEHLQQANLQASPPLLEWLQGQEIRSFADIRRKGGLSTGDLAEADTATARQIEALADLDRLSPSVQVSKILLDKGYASVEAIADAPYTEFVNDVAGDEPGLTALDAAELHLVARIQNNLLNNILAAAAAADGYML